MYSANFTPERQKIAHLKIIFLITFACIFCACIDTENSRGDPDTDTYLERAGPYETVSETETESQFDTDTDSSISTADIQSDTQSDTQSEISINAASTETENANDICLVTVDRILECQGNGARYYEFKDACDSEFLNDKTQCAFNCMDFRDCDGFLTCFGGC